MATTKVIGPFTGKLVFKNAEGQELDISKVSNLSLTVNDEAIGNVTLNPDGTFGGNGIAAGDLVLTASATNDAGNPVGGANTISFHADTTVTEIDVNVD